MSMPRFFLCEAAVGVWSSKRRHKSPGFFPGSSFRGWLSTTMPALEDGPFVSAKEVIAAQAYFASSSPAFAGSTFSWKSSSTMHTGPKPQLAKHSANSMLYLPSGLTAMG